jgi:hypothetical protein
MAEDTIEKASPRRDWFSYLIQSAATLVAVIIAMLAGGSSSRARSTTSR